MNISGGHISALQALGYTPDEARFLYMAATHSGYFLPRQFLHSCGAKWGKRSNHFTQKLESRGHATWREYPDLGGVYHLISKLLYRVLDKEHLRNHRRHSIEYIRTRLLVLDFVLSNHTHDYLETESERLAHFCDTLGIPKSALPVKVYAKPPGSGSTLRYFVDKFPLFLARETGSSAPAVTFSYVDSGEATLAGFARHLKAYKQLLASLSDFRFFYIANSPVHFAAAERYFRSFISHSFQADAFAEMLRYFRLRAAWDQKQYASLSHDDIEWLEEANRRFQGRDTERLYARWSAGELLENALTPRLAEVGGSDRFQFSPYLVAAGQTTVKEFGKAG